MLYQGIIGGGSSPVEPVDLSPELLWTNPNPNTAFAETSLTLDLSNYVAILVEYGSRIKNQPDCVISGWYCKVIDLPNANATNKNVIGTDNSATVSGRRIWYEPSTKALTIGANYGTNESNNQAIPFNIYGVKEYVVEVQQPVQEPLWTNPNPSDSTFAPTTINGDYSKYNYFIIFAKPLSGEEGNTAIPKNVEKDVVVDIDKRAFKITDTSIEIKAGYLNAQVANDRCIPLKIFGVNINA